jgi:hypothetical protein
MRTLSGSVLGGALVALTAAACSSPPQRPAFEFMYRGSLACGDCSQALDGSIVELLVSGPAAGEVRVADPAVGEVGDGTKTFCSCRSANPGEPREVELSEACVAGEERRCSVHFSVATKSAGDSEVELVDAEGARLSAFTLRVRRAARVELHVEVEDEPIGPSADGVYELPRERLARIRNEAFDDRGQPLACDFDGFETELGTIATMSGPVVDLSRDFALMESRGVSELDVVVRASGAEATARFRLVP